MTAPIVIIGGGIVGSCTALFLAEHMPVIVLEKDPSYQFASTTLSAASFRQQFSLPVNLHMSRFGAGFLEERAERVGLVRRAYLILATAAGEAQLKANRAMQLAEGAKVALFDGPAAIAERFPWLHTEDLACATLGLANEGWFDAYSLLRAVREEAIAGGARYVADEATGIDLVSGTATAVRTAKGERIAAGHVVIAAGRHAGRVAAMAGVALPVAGRKRTVFVLRAPLENAGMPLMFDTTGAWLRPEGEGFIGGISPTPENDPDPGEDFDPDIDLLEEQVWPALAHRI
ncbi:MAG TPA: FAD-binding oxidoreductase, partial [Acetobacteraceae bacterium]|nr:FAD-binding oxidoreductase [Acetobacteraceae bacterium]